MTVQQGVQLEVRSSGHGEPLMLIQTALLPDEVARLGGQPELSDGHRVVDLRRRGYGMASPPRGSGSVALDSRDCLAVLRALGIDRAHVVGASYSAAVALELLATAPGMVASLTVIEPPPVHGAYRHEFREANERLVRIFIEQGVTAALDEFSRALGGPSWLDERTSAGDDHVAGVRRDATTFFASDIPALLNWTVDPGRLAGLRVPVLTLGGADTHEWFRDMPAWVAGLLPHSEPHLSSGAGHGIVGTHTAEVAQLLADFVGRHRRHGPG